MPRKALKKLLSPWTSSDPSVKHKTHYLKTLIKSFNETEKPLDKPNKKRGRKPKKKINPRKLTPDDKLSSSKWLKSASSDQKSKIEESKTDYKNKNKTSTEGKELNYDCFRLRRGQADYIWEQQQKNWFF